MGDVATQQSSHVIASAFFPQAALSESGVEEAAAVPPVAVEPFPAGAFVEPFGAFVLSPAVLAFFDDDVGTGSAAPLQPIAANATNEERQRAMQVTCFMSHSHCRLQADPDPGVHPLRRPKNRGFMRRTGGDPDRRPRGAVWIRSARTRL
jgi:hypothetical protein